MSEEQEIFDAVRSIREQYRGRGFSWNRFRGDAISRILVFYLNKNLPAGFKTVQLGWVESCPTEFDLLIVKETAEPIAFTGAYPQEQVHLLVEVKASGLFYPKNKVGQVITQLIDSWTEATGKPVLYLSFWERPSYAEIIINALGEDRAFLLRIGKKQNKGEWKRFLQKVKEILN